MEFREDLMTSLVWEGREMKELIESGFDACMEMQLFRQWQAALFGKGGRKSL